MRTRTNNGAQKAERKGIAVWATKKDKNGKKLVSQYSGEALVRFTAIVNEPLEVGMQLVGFMDTGREKTSGTEPDVFLRVVDSEEPQTAARPVKMARAKTKMKAVEEMADDDEADDELFAS